MVGLAAAAVGLATLDQPEPAQTSADAAPQVSEPLPSSVTLTVRRMHRLPGQGPGDRREPGRSPDRGADRNGGGGRDDEQGPASGGADGTPVVPASSLTAGRWGPTVDLPLVPTGVAMVPGNRLMLWSTFGADGPAGEQTQTAVLDLDSLTVTTRTVAGSDQELLGSGVVSLSDGRLLVAGGGASAQVSLFNPYVDAWSAALKTVNASSDVGLALMPDGRAVAVTGSGADPEVWTDGHGWSDLAGAQPAPGDDGSGQRWLFPTGDDQLLQMGPDTVEQVSLTGTGSSTTLGDPLPSGMADGTAVLYDGNHVLVLGGAVDDGEGSAGQAWVVDLSGDGPQVSPTGSLHQDRTFSNSVVLPDGEVLAIGDGKSLDPEIWDPASGRWREVAPTSVPHAGRSIAVLLPDGRVFVGGGERGSNDDVNGQVYTPGYLLNDDGSPRDRPEVTGGPYTMDVGSTVTVTTDGPVDSFALMRMASSTTAADNDQRRVPLTIVNETPQPDGSVSYRLLVPADDSVALPGNYLFFALDTHGTPSRSQQVNIPLP